jgi:CRISPR-associated protein Cmr5
MPEQLNDTGGKRLELRSVRQAREVLAAMKGVTLQKEDVSFLKALPTMLMQNGLGQTLAFMAAKEKVAEQIFPILTQLLFQKSGKEKVMATITESTDIRKYIDKQREAMEYAAWMKKFAVAFHQKKSGE